MVGDTDVVIIGGGIGGLAAAAFLQQAGRKVRVFEQAPEVKAVGAGILVTPNAGRLIRRLGVMETFERAAVRLEEAWRFRRWSDGSVLFSEVLGEDCRRLYGEYCYVAHRADLLDSLRAAVDGDSVVLGKRCSHVEQSGDGVRVSFDDGTTVTADMVIGADGVRSAVARAVTDKPEPVFSHLAAYRCLIPAADAPDFMRDPIHTVWLGPGRHFVHYPISGGKYINIVALVPESEWRAESWSTQGALDDFEAEFAGWDPHVSGLIGVATSVERWALFDREPLSQWVNGSIALLGDAAHPMYPFFGQGAAQAIEDAAVLGRCLADESVDHRTALLNYQKARIARATEVQIRSRERAGSHHLPDGPEQRIRDERFKKEDRYKHNAWLYAHDAEESIVPKGSAV
ncbi:FAD-dependent monooxygenase [Saccharopolyspora shandongensis]|uniref:FAD-dependent monooxygenase n=1 Tax=Saccharopolyspora shandongensis TaxID=418495 RepID=UPI0033CF89F7